MRRFAKILRIDFLVLVKSLVHAASNYVPTEAAKLCNLTHNCSTFLAKAAISRSTTIIHELLNLYIRKEGM